MKTRRGEEIQDLYNKLIEGVNQSLTKIDEEGFAFLTNQEKGKPTPIEFAREFGFKKPIFKFKQIMRGKDWSDSCYESMLKSDEAVWVKEGLEV